MYLGEEETEEKKMGKSYFIEWQSGRQPDSVWFALNARPIFFWNLGMMMMMVMMTMVMRMVMMMRRRR